MAYKNIEDNCAYHREYMKERRQWFKDHHVCIECGKQDAYTLNGRARCYECNEKHNKSNVKNMTEKRKLHIKQYREKKRAEGFCVRCGKRKAVSDKVHCSVCLARNKIRLKKQHSSEIPRGERHSYNLCYRCGNPLDGQLKADGEKSRLCSKCYNKMPKPPRTRIVYAPLYINQKSLAVWQDVLKKREELLANGTYDFIPIKLNPTPVVGRCR